MARVCDICGKGVQHGQNVSHAHNVTKRRWEVNLQNVRAVVQGRPKKLRVCTRCLRSGAVQKGMRQKEAQRARTAQT
jgi:large subunit ribosomal protein L28